jgi:hypothetical protein
MLLCRLRHMLRAVLADFEPNTSAFRIFQDAPKPERDMDTDVPGRNKRNDEGALTFLPSLVHVVCICILISA